jgi:hypothetical protein
MVRASCPAAGFARRIKFEKMNSLEYIGLRLGQTLEIQLGLWY